ncbi:hypothetical protein [Streptomyces sp. NPDC058989]|uniref:hypothetical protein n=1 Tax=Streptomyces sp. NPDC058989 TaxID=3346686 RepID=UPI0036939357
MAEVVTGCGGEGLSLTGVITAVDPARVLDCLGRGDDLADVGLAAAASDQRTVADTWARQLEYAPVLAIATGKEAAEPADLALLEQLHPTARRIPVGSAELAADRSRGRFWLADRPDALRQLARAMKNAREMALLPYASR